MHIPYEFEQFVKGFFPGSTEGTTTWEEWSRSALKFKDERQREVIREFLDQLLSGSYSDEEIEEVWRMQYPSYDFSSGGHRMFLSEVRKFLDAETKR
jgi:hypothetical protein